MPAPDRRTLCIAALGAAVVAAGIAGLASLDSPPPSAAARTPPAPHEIPMPASAPAARSVAAGTPARAQAWHPEDSTETVARRYREAADLREFYARASSTGGAAHLWFADLIGVFGSGAADLQFGPWKYADGEAATESNRRLVREQRAWLLAACELGMDCGRGSLTWYSACLGSGDCSDANSVSGAAAELGRAALPAILRRRDAIVAAIRARDWPALGL